MEFESFYFYTNQRALKNYLVNYKIEPLSYHNEQNRTLSDLGQNYLLFWKGGVNANIILNNCKTDGADVPVVLKVLLPTDETVVAYFSDGTIKPVKVADGASAYAVKVAQPITFFNVSDIFYIDKRIQFLQGDTTLIIPKQLIREGAYNVSVALDDKDVDNVIKAFSKSEGKMLLDNEDDEAEFSVDLLSNLTNETDEEKDVREKSQKEDRINAAYLMFIQGGMPYDGSFSHRLYSVIGSYEIPFDKVICDSFYKPVLPEIVSKNIRYLTSKDADYIMALNGIRADSIYTPAISAILKNGYSFDDKERFLHDFLAETEASSREEMKTVFEDKRARNRIQLLLNENPKLAPIYFLYTFFDYRQDHFCENIIEFGMRDAGFSNVTLSLWALLHGMTDIYAEYKKIELLYAITCKENDRCIDYRRFAEYNSIEPKKECILLNNLSCRYINPKIEYYHCIGVHEEKIKKLIDSLTKELKCVFDFQYISLKNAIKATKTEISDKEIIENKEIIHKKYLQSLQNEKPKKQRKPSKVTQIQTSFFD